MPEYWQHKAIPRIKVKFIGHCECRITCRGKHPGVIYTDGETTTVRGLEEFKQFFKPI